jgi:hypothetical protein
MSFTSVTPGLVPHVGVVAYIVLDDFGKAGRVYREAAEADATLEAVIDDLLTGQFNNPVRVVAFNTSEGWSRDVSEDVARSVKARGGKRPASCDEFAADRRSLCRRRRTVARRKRRCVSAWPR